MVEIEIYNKPVSYICGPKSYAVRVTYECGSYLYADMNKVPNVCLDCGAAWQAMGSLQQFDNFDKDFDDEDGEEAQ